MGAGELVNLCKTALASAVMGLCVRAVLETAAPLLPAGKLGELACLALCAGLGAALYFALALLLRVDEARMAVSLVKKKK